MMRDFQFQTGVLFNDYHGQAAPVQLDDLLQNELHHHRRETEGRLIEAQQVRLRHQCAAFAK